MSDQERDDEERRSRRRESVFSFHCQLSRQSRRDDCEHNSEKAKRLVARRHPGRLLLSLPSQTHLHFVNRTISTEDHGLEGAEKDDTVCLSSLNFTVFLVSERR